MQNCCFFLFLMALSFSYRTGHCQTSYPPKHELRGVWIATVANIDWPSKAGLSSRQQQKELVEILDLHEENGMNAIVMQVRPAADAFYYSRYEPWSEWLGGEAGKPPFPYYDPLQFAIEEVHKSGMEFHAWFNPYRAVFDTAKMDYDTLHVTRQQPDWFLTYGNRRYFDPGIPEVRKHVTEVIRDVVLRYDLDAIHFDDYFYPYKIAGTDFPDSLSFLQYGEEFIPENIEDWRRQNVDSIIEMLSLAIKDVKPRVRFGISPFGVWRNKDKDPDGSDTRAGQTNYDDLYADVLKWLKLGWIDYVAPQIYWPIGFAPADHGVLVDWWNRHAYGRHVYIGHGAYRIGSEKPEAWKDPAEMPRQLRMSREHGAINGNIFFSSKSFKGNPLGFSDSLKTDFYRYKALPPSFSWIDNSPPSPPSSLKAQKGIDGEVLLRWQAPTEAENEPIYYVIYRVEGKAKDGFSLSDPANILSITRTPETMFSDFSAEKRGKYTYLITAYDRVNNESQPGPAIYIKNRKRRVKWKVMEY